MQSRRYRIFYEADRLESRRHWGLARLGLHGVPKQKIKRWRHVGMAPIASRPRVPRRKAGERVTESQFWENVHKTDTCWLWTGTVNRDGYGCLRFGDHPPQVSTHAHVVSWKLKYGEYPRWLQVLHKCDVPNCINPEHLFLGTISDNVRDSVAKKRHSESRKTECKHGHAFTPENTIIHTRSDGRKRRECRHCTNKRTREWQKRQGR